VLFFNWRVTVTKKGRICKKLIVMLETGKEIGAVKHLLSNALISEQDSQPKSLCFTFVSDATHRLPQIVAPCAAAPLHQPCPQLEFRK
jgi:hypothetical protein